MWLLATQISSRTGPWVWVSVCVCCTMVALRSRWRVSSCTCATARAGMASRQFAQRVAARMKQLGYGQAAIGKILQPLTKRPAQCDQAFAHVTATEEELIRHLHADGLGVKRIAAALGRSTDTVSKHLFRKCKKKPVKVGRKACITEGKYKHIHKGYQRLLRNARGKEVTVKMVKKDLKLKCSEKTVSRAFWARGVHFRPLYEKPDLSLQDIKDRLAWAKAHSHRSAAQWGRALMFNSCGHLFFLFCVMSR